MAERGDCRYEKPIPLPAGVTVTVDGSSVKVKGPKGEMSYTARPEMSFRIEDGVLTVERISKEIVS